jgi:hypothetical protein
VFIIIIIIIVYLHPYNNQICNLSLSPQYFPTLLKPAAIVPVFRKGCTASVSNYRTTSLLIHLCKLQVVQFVVHEHFSHHITFKSNSCQHDFSKAKFTVTNLATYLDFIIPLAGFQRQADTTSLDLSSEYNPVTHTCFS